MAQRAEPNVSGLIEHADGEIAFPKPLLRSQVHNVPQAPAAVAYAEAVDPVALAAWLFGDALIKRLDAAIDAEADDKNAMTPEAREKAEAVVMADLLSVSRDEAALVWIAQSEMLPVEHRADCSPLALLGLRLVATSKRPAPATSGAHAFDLAGR